MDNKKRKYLNIFNFFQFGVEIRERAMWDIRNSMVGTETFEPKHIVIATWKNVSFAGGIPSASRIVRNYKTGLR